MGVSGDAPDPSPAMGGVAPPREPAAPGAPASRLAGTGPGGAGCSTTVGAAAAGGGSVASACGDGALCANGSSGSSASGGAEGPNGSTLGGVGTGCAGAVGMACRRARRGFGRGGAATLVGAGWRTTSVTIGIVSGAPAPSSNFTRSVERGPSATGTKKMQATSSARCATPEPIRHRDHRLSEPPAPRLSRGIRLASSLTATINRRPWALPDPMLPVSSIVVLELETQTDQKIDAGRRHQEDVVAEGP